MHVTGTIHVHLEKEIFPSERKRIHPFWPGVDLRIVTQRESAFSLCLPETFASLSSISLSLPFDFSFYSLVIFPVATNRLLLRHRQSTSGLHFNSTTATATSATRTAPLQVAPHRHHPTSTATTTTKCDQQPNPLPLQSATKPSTSPPHRPYHSHPFAVIMNIFAAQVRQVLVKNKSYLVNPDEMNSGRYFQWPPHDYHRLDRFSALYFSPEKEFNYSFKTMEQAIQYAKRLANHIGFQLRIKTTGINARDGLVYKYVCCQRQGLAEHGWKPKHGHRQRQRDSVRCDCKWNCKLIGVRIEHSVEATVDGIGPRSPRDHDPDLMWVWKSADLDKDFDHNHVMDLDFKVISGTNVVVGFAGDANVSVPVYITPSPSTRTNTNSTQQSDPQAPIAPVEDGDASAALLSLGAPSSSNILQSRSIGGTALTATQSPPPNQPLQHLQQRPSLQQSRPAYSFPSAPSSRASTFGAPYPVSSSSSSSSSQQALSSTMTRGLPPHGGSSFVPIRTVAPGEILPLVRMGQPSPSQPPPVDATPIQLAPLHWTPESSSSSPSPAKLHALEPVIRMDTRMEQSKPSYNWTYEGKRRKK